MNVNSSQIYFNLQKKAYHELHMKKSDVFYNYTQNRFSSAKQSLGNFSLNNKKSVTVANHFNANDAKM